jgi:hypothetical protein
LSLIFSHSSNKVEKDWSFNGLRRPFISKDAPSASRNPSTKVQAKHRPKPVEERRLAVLYRRWHKLPQMRQEE